MPLPAGPGIFSAETGAPAVSGGLPTLLLSELLMTSEPHTARHYHAYTTVKASLQINACGRSSAQCLARDIKEL